MKKPDRMAGTIARVLLDKKFGFIRGEDQIERFFHASGLEYSTNPGFESLREGMQVEFTAIQGEKGPRAIEVRVL